MVELSPGSHVYIFQKDMEYVSRIPSGKKAALFLMSCFYSHDELVNMTLSGGNGKKSFSKPCLGAICVSVTYLIEYWDIAELGTGLCCTILAYFQRI